MKIALISTPWISLPPKGYGGIEKIVFELEEGLVHRGHDVTTFSTGDSTVSGKLEFLYKQNIGFNTLSGKGDILLFLNHIYHAIKSIDPDTDIIHNHTEFYGMHLLDHSPIPFVHTLHSAFYENLDQDRMKGKDNLGVASRQTLQIFKNHPFVTISNQQRKWLQELNVIDTVYNGVDITKFPFTLNPSDYIAWLGRFAPVKGLDNAITVAKELKKKLIIAGVISRSWQTLFTNEISPSIDDKMIVFNGPVSTYAEKSKLLGMAKLFLFPIKWEEPFGIVMIEAMAYGTPVVAFARGSVPEVIKDGVTGFLVNPSDNDIRGNWLVKRNGIAGLKEAVERIYNMPESEYQVMRRNSRQHVEAHFTVEKMIDGYEKVYNQILKKSPR